jgi:hypothetical protein
MKKLFFGLVAMVFFMFSFTTKENANKLETLKPWYLALLTLEIDVKFGENKVINGVRYSCIGSGVCSIKVGRKAPPPVKTDLSDVKNDKPFIAFDENGSIYIIANESYRRDELLKSFTLNNKVEIDNETISILNKIAKSINPNVKEFKGIVIGTKLTPYNEDGFNKLKLN